MCMNNAAHCRTVVSKETDIEFTLRNHTSSEYFVFHCQKNDKSSCDTNRNPVNSERDIFIKRNLSKKKTTKGP